MFAVPFRTLCAAAVCALLLAAPAQARDPGRWQLSGYSSLPVSYWQGVTGDGAGRFFFDGVSEGLYGTSGSLLQTGANPRAIPAAVAEVEGYNHIGDIGYDRSEGGRVLLPFECYVLLLQPGDSNTCGTGSIGVADPATLGLRYYVKLDPAEIPKAMWVEPAPDGSLLWTSSGKDLLAYRAADVTAANAPPAAPIRAARRLRGATPPSGITGGAFLGGRLFLAGSDAGPFQVWSVDPANGRRRLEVELPRVSGESEGLHAAKLLGGELHWLIAPLAIAGPLSYGPTSALLHFTRLRGKPGLRVRVHPAARGKPATRARARSRGFVATPWRGAAGNSPDASAAIRVRIVVSVSRHGKPVRRARVRFAGERARTDKHGRATLGRNFDVPGRYRVLASAAGRRGRSGYVTVDVTRSGAVAAVPLLPVL